MNSVMNGMAPSKLQPKQKENTFQFVERTLHPRMIAGLLMTAVFLAGTARSSAAQQANQVAAQPGFQVLHVFNKAGDGQAPMAGVKADAAGNLFGSAEFGGANGFG